VPKIDLLFRFGCRPFSGSARTDFILNSYSEEPAIAGVCRCDFQSGDCRHFAQILALFIAEMITFFALESPAPQWCASWSF